jgi:S1-C subfamily serine protease
VTGTAGTPVSGKALSAPPAPVKLSPGEIEGKYCDAVVTLESYNDQGQKLSQGSGFIFSVEGKVLTNYHVIRGASRMRARLRDQSTRDVESIAGYDIEHDLAALKISGGEFPVVRLGSSAAVKTGDHVTALGAPLGLEYTLSDGIISAIRDFGQSRIFQTSAPISHGSSGGPLFDDFGHVVGVIVATVEAGENLNFAVPIDSAKRLFAGDRNTTFAELLLATTVRQQILNSSLSLPPQVVPVDVVVPKQGATLFGSFSIVGGMRNDLGLRLIGPDGNIVWNAGVLQNSASLNLRLAHGRYRLVFDNKVTSWWVSPKTISGTVELSYYR